ncbi:uncharacterized protein LOC131238046 [Magnolia sinica]|uniref:uncharacterized protein LOC131238046 n=1 Tax=Magnolia sinica TaxID=86752 RepID=UPI002657F346|nr:uncharacterized protein LOC131238046 [Magnolia sinica]
MAARIVLAQSDSDTIILLFPVWKVYQARKMDRYSLKGEIGRLDMFRHLQSVPFDALSKAQSIEEDSSSYVQSPTSSKSTHSDLRSQSHQGSELNLLSLLQDSSAPEVIVAEPLQIKDGNTAVKLLEEDQRAALVKKIHRKKWIRDAMGHVGRLLGLSFGDCPEDFLALFQCVKARGRFLDPNRTPQKRTPRVGKNKKLKWKGSSSNSIADLRPRERLKGLCSPQIICLQETKVKVLDDRLMKTLWKASDAKWVAKDDSGSSRGILIAWRTAFWSLVKSTTGDFSVSVIPRNNDSAANFLIYSVHGPTNNALRDAFWKELTLVRHSFDGPVCFVGDFNATRFANEKSSSLKTKTHMVAFSSWIDSNGTTFDHWPLLLSTEEVDWGLKPFRFDISWLHRAGFKSMVTEWWKELQSQGFAGFRLCSKLKVLKEKLRQWNKEERRTSERDMDSILSKIQQIDSHAESNPMTKESLAKRIQLVQLLSAKVLEDEISWKQKARAKWIKEGDRNTKYFHSITSMHARVNRINSIMLNGYLSEDRETISQEAISYFQGLLQNEGWSRPRLDNLSLRIISEEDASALELPFSIEEVKEAVNALEGDKAPGPDGYPIQFFQIFWDLLQEEVMEFLNEFHARGRISTNIGATFIALVPKFSGASEFKDFRPINLIGSLYKILAKTLANCLLKVIGPIISPNQCAFISGRQIIDGSLIANECLHSNHRSKKKFIFCNLDMEKTYDHVDWDFLLYMMKRMGFDEVWRKWIKECISSTRFSILLNGSPKGFFKSSRGLRQGDPLSPFLFLIIGEALSSMLLKGQTKVIRCFAAVAGLKVNMFKFIIYGVNMDNQEAAWKCHCLSIGGRLTLIKAALSNLPTHFMSLFRCPVTVLKSIDSLRRNSLWRGKDDKKNFNLMEWRQVCKPITEYGAGIKELKTMNRALLGKWIWRLGTEKNSLWNKIIKGKYGSSEGDWWTSESSLYRTSAIWKGIYRLKKDVIQRIGFTVGKGDCIHFWTDIWLGDNPLKEKFPSIFRLAVKKNSLIADNYSIVANRVIWNIKCRRNLEDWEISEFVELLDYVHHAIPNQSLKDSLTWKADKSSVFTVRSLYTHLRLSEGNRKFLINTLPSYITGRRAHRRHSATWVGESLTFSGVMEQMC